MTISVSTIADRAVLVKFTKRTFTQYKKDKKATTCVETNLGVAKAGNFNKKLMAEAGLVEEANQAANAAYLFYFNNTSPWLDEEGQRMLGNEFILPFTQELNALIHEANKTFDRLELDWNNLVMRDVARLGPLGNFNDYPASVRGCYEVSYVLRPVPTQGDFRVPVPQEELDKLENMAGEAAKVAVMDAVTRVMKPIAAAAERLAEYTKGEQEGKRQKFYESVILNIGEQTRQARKLNIMGDVQLAAICDEIDSLMQPHILAPEQVKENIATREVAQAKLNDIMAKMSGMWGV